MTKRHDERKELLQEDEIHSFLERIARTAIENSKQTLLLVFGAAAIIASIYLWIWKQDSALEAQSAELYKTEKIQATKVGDEKAELKFATEKEKIEAGLKQLDASLGSLSGASKQQALVKKVALLVSMGKQDEAAKLYSEIQNGGSELKMLGVVGEADVLAAQEKYEEARAKYASLIGMDDFVAYKKAELFKLEGKLDDAKSELTKLVERYKDEDVKDKPPIFQKAETMLKELTATDADKKDA